MNERKWFVGIDWATQEHAVCILDDAGEVIAERVFPHSGTGIAEMCTWLLETTRAAPSSIHVAIEVPHGAVVETLLERGIVVFSVNPKQLDRFRDRFSVAGAKDDRRDARVLGDSLRTDSKAFRLLKVDDALIIELREWSRMADDLQDERLRLCNRFRQQLLRYYPAMLELADDIFDEPFLRLWELAPTPKAAAGVREKTVTKLLIEKRITRFDAKHVLATLRQKPLTVAPGTTEAATAHIASLVERIRLLNRQLKDAHRRLDKLIEDTPARESEPGQKCEQRDVDILRSLAGIGRTVLATLLAEAWQPLGARDYHALRTLTGVAPVTQSSGKRKGKHAIVVMRRACNARLREAVYHWARVACQHDPKMKATYAALRARGHAHGRALRTVADRLLRVACAMLRDGTLFDAEQRRAA